MVVVGVVYLFGGVDVGMHFCAYLEGVKVRDREEFEFGHDRSGVCSRG